MGAGPPGRRGRWWRHLSWALFAASVPVAPAWAGCQLQQMQIPVRVVDSRPIATLTLNGTPVPLLVDSGAFFSMLSMSTATQLQLPLRSLPSDFRVEGYTGRIEVRRTTVDKVGLLGAELAKVQFLVGGNELGAGIMGVLGRNILAAADTEYDLAHGVVRLSYPKGECDKTNFAYWAGEAPVVVTPLDGQDHDRDTEIRLNVKVNGTRVLALLDTGAPRTSLTLSAAHRAGIEDRDMTPSGRIGGAGEGRVKSWTGRVAMLELGGEKITDNILPIDDTSYPEIGAVVGLDYFLSHRIYVSMLQRQVYVTWNGGPIFAQGRATPGSYDTRYAALPQDVAKDDADSLARRGAAAIAAKDYPRALEDLNRACELAPGVADNFYARARVHMAMREGGLALADLDEALRLDPALAETRMRRAVVRAELGDRPGAQADLTQLHAALPASAPLREDMANLYASFDRAPEALRQFDLWVRTHEKDARMAGVLNNRCWLRARLNIDLPLALDDCKEAVARDDGAASYRDSLGWTYLRLGDAAKAKRAFEGAIEIEPRPFSLYGRALAELRMNDTAGAERDLAAARKLKPLIDEEVLKQGFEFAEGVARPKVSGS